MVRVVPSLYSVGRYAIFVSPDSRIERLYELRDVPVGIGQMAGSHFTTLKTLGEVLPKEHIKTVHTGGPGQRLVALQEGEVEAANLLDPEIPIAEARGLRKLGERAQARDGHQQPGDQELGLSHTWSVPIRRPDDIRPIPPVARSATGQSL